MQSNKDDAIWIKCPYCNRKTKTKIYQNTVLIKFPLFCPWCRKEYIVDLVKRKMVVAKEPDA